MRRIIEIALGLKLIQKAPMIKAKEKLLGEIENQGLTGALECKCKCWNYQLSSHQLRCSV